MTDNQLKKLVFKAGIVQTILTALIGAAMWLYSQGRANADIVHQNELAPMKEDIRVIREDVAYVRGRLEGIK